MSPQRIHLWAQRDQFVNRLGRNPKLGIEAHFPRKIFHSIHFHIYLLSWEAFGGISLCFSWRWKSFTTDYYEGNQRGKKIQFLIKKINFCPKMTSDDTCCRDHLYETRRLFGCLRQNKDFRRLDLRRLKVKIYYSINPWSAWSESNKQLRHFSVTFPHILEWMDHDFELFANQMRSFVDNVYFKGESYIYLKSRFISTVLMHKPCFFVPLLKLNF